MARSGEGNGDLKLKWHFQWKDDQDKKCPAWKDYKPDEQKMFNEMIDQKKSQGTFLHEYQNRQGTHKTTKYIVILSHMIQRNPHSSNQRAMRAYNPSSALSHLEWFCAEDVEWVDKEKADKAATWNHDGHCDDDAWNVESEKAAHGRSWQNNKRNDQKSHGGGDGNDDTYLDQQAWGGWQHSNKHKGCGSDWHGDNNKNGSTQGAHFSFYHPRELAK